MKLVLLTSQYPYGKEETFVENELRCIAQYFDKIIIYNFWDGDQNDDHKFIPDNAVVKCVPGLFGNRFGSIKCFLSAEGLKELYFDITKLHYRISKQVIMGIGQYLLARKLLSPYLQQEESEDTIFYSYWLGLHAFSLSTVKHRNPRAFCISRCHNVDCFLERQTSFFRRETLGLMDYIFPCSNEGTREITEKILPYIQKNVPVVETSYLGVNCGEVYNPSDSDGALHIVSCSNVYEVKRLDLIIDALSMITNIKIVWDHFGDGRLFKNIQNYAKEKLVKKNIKYCFHGLVKNSTIRDYYANNHIDIFVNVSDYEGIPVSIMEAMSYGIICIARDIGGNKEVINQQENCGILLKSQIIPQDLVNAIKYVANLSTSEKERIRKNAAKFIRSSFNQDITYHDFVKKLLKLRKENNADNY